MTKGSTTTEFVDGNYQDWNNPLNKIEVLRRQDHRARDGTVLRI